jgi:hypothetical protein
MTFQRLCVLYLPSEHEAAWRSAVSEAARTAGWRVVDLIPGQPAPGHDQNILINIVDVELSGLFEPSECLILADDPDETAGNLEVSHGLDRDAALRIVARQYAAAAALAESGWLVAEIQDRQINLPGLGEITREGPSPVIPRQPPGPIGFYRTLPPRPGVSVEWPLDLLLRYELGETARVPSDLTGRRRLLRHGPFIELSPGFWTAHLVFDLMIDSARVELRFEWGTMHDVTVVTDLMTTSGRYSVSLSKLWTEPAVAELRIWLDRAVFDGQMDLVSCQVSFTPA